MATDTVLLGPDSSGRWVVAKDGCVVDSGQDSAPPTCDVSIPCTGATIEAGAVNAHTHLYSGLVPLGMDAPEPPPENFLQILERVWWPLDRALDAPTLDAATRYYIAHALLNGTTALIDHHESPECVHGVLDVLADACQNLGMRACLCYGVSERNKGRREAQDGLAECERFVLSNSRALVCGVVGVHASFTVSDDTLRDAGWLCRKLDVPLHVHVAEDVSDVEDAVARGYKGPLERLAQLNALPPRSLLAHGVHLSPEQVRWCEEHELWLIHNPRSNKNNRVGYASSLTHSSRVALGTDGFASDMGAESAALSDEAAMHEQSGARIASRAGASRELFWDVQGQKVPADVFAPGGPADFVVRDGDGSVLHVMVAGVPVVDSGCLVFGEIEQITADAKRAAASLWERIRGLPESHQRIE